MVGKSGADPGFPIGGGANCTGGAPTTEFAKFSKKLHEIEKNSDLVGGGGGAPDANANGWLTSYWNAFLLTNYLT